MSSYCPLPIWKNTMAVWEISMHATCKITPSCFWLLLMMGRTCKATNCHLVIIYITELIAVITIQTASHTSLIGFASSCHSRLILSGCFPDEYFTETLVRVHAGFAMPSTLSKPHQTINLVAACWLYLPLTSHARA